MLYLYSDTFFKDKKTTLLRKKKEELFQSHKVPLSTQSLVTVEIRVRISGMGRRRHWCVCKVHSHPQVTGSGNVPHATFHNSL